MLLRRQNKISTYKPTNGRNTDPNSEHYSNNAQNLQKYSNFPCSYSSFRHKN